MPRRPQYLAPSVEPTGRHEGAGELSGHSGQPDRTHQRFGDAGREGERLFFMLIKKAGDNGGEVEVPEGPRRLIVKQEQEEQ